MNRYIDLLSKIVIWGGIAFILLFILLKSLGIIGSPSLTESLLIFILGELIRIESRISDFVSKSDFNKLTSRFELVWRDFKKRKRV